MSQILKDCVRLLLVPEHLFQCIDLARAHVPGARLQIFSTGDLLKPDTLQMLVDKKIEKRKSLFLNSMRKKRAQSKNICSAQCRNAAGSVRATERSHVNGAWRDGTASHDSSVFIAAL